MAAAQANHQEHIILQIETAEHTGAGRRVIASKGKIKIGLGKQRWHQTSRPSISLERPFGYSLLL